jgi:hypothetical protein
MCLRILFGNNNCGGCDNSCGMSVNNGCGSPCAANNGCGFFGGDNCWIILLLLFFCR